MARPRPTALVTGAAVRLGRAIAEHLAGRGFDLVLHYGKSEAQAKRLARTLEKRGRRALAVQAELGDPASIEAMFAAIDGFTPRLDLIVNSAAAFERAAFLTLTPAQISKMLASNLLGPMLICRHGAERMRGKGQIVNLLDIGGALQAWPGFAHYASAKAGLTMLTKILALELAPGIRVNGLAPGTVLVPERYGPEEIARLIARIPLRRLGRPADVLRALDYLLEAPFVTGTVMVLDGGRSLGTGGAEVA